MSLEVESNAKPLKINTYEKFTTFLSEIQGLPEMSVTTLKLCAGQSFQYIFLVHIAN